VHEEKKTFRHFFVLTDEIGVIIDSCRGGLYEAIVIGLENGEEHFEKRRENNRAGSMSR